MHLVSGSEDDIAVARPVLEATGSRTVVAGTDAGPGSALKLACNAWIASITAATGQSLGLARLLGVEPGSSSTRSRAAPPTPRTRTSRAARCSPASSRRPSRSTACSRT
ncbi:hypothetical protein BC477_10255 [Clavibacter michiganensis subsp. michiganensis]|uniref:Uncharacterized protein n=1 Tax=Clavibacter michiganensis subsp. michiganensis TaxID=33013 RepID=A0A251XNZ0_CLAMM|nr:hypothetical protein BC477_10255 [Clavibacter michiganensis subsp. michiganensis]OUE05110.1 hypothetical protein CMMCAS07_09175 [Clavibacter michiganensis subsp. michiganensis]